MLDRLGRFILLAAVIIAVLWIRLLPSQRTDPESQFVGSDGRKHVLLGDYDSYFWLRQARNQLHHGATCDSVVNGECRDEHTLAPVGIDMQYAHSYHSLAIAGLHRLITRFAPDYPLPATAFWIPVIVGTLGVLAAFGLGVRLAGTIGGAWAALLGALHPVFLERSIGADNDVWNVVLPLFLMWAGVAAVQATSRARCVLFATLAGLAAALHAQIWSGSAHMVAVMVAGSLLCVLTHGLIAIRRGHRPWRDRTVGNAVVVVVAFALSTLCAMGAGKAVSLWTSLWNAINPGSDTAATGFEQAAVAWPDVLSSVGETRKLGLAGVRNNLGAGLLSAGWFGCFLLMLQSSDRRRWRIAIGVIGAVVGGWVLLRADLDSRAAIVLLSAPIVAAWSLNVWRGQAFEPTSSAAILLAVWQMSALSLACDALRFTMILIPALAIGAAVLVGRAHRILVRWLCRVAPSWQAVGGAVLLVAFVAPAFYPIRRAVGFVRSHTPAIDAAWWDTLSEIGQSTPSESIVHTWWNAGYWAAFVADRRVSADGGTLRTQVHYWLARALLSADENEAVGLLRMLDCGSDATPLPEGRMGAYGKLVAHGVDPAYAPVLLTELVKRDRESAATLLASWSFASAARDDVLRSTHCTPPPAVLVLSEVLSRTTDWPYFGSWSFAEAEARKYLQPFDEAKALEVLTQRFELSAEAARALFTRIRQRPPPDMRQRSLVYPTNQWATCSSIAETRTFQCQPKPSKTGGLPLVWITVGADDPTRSQLFVSDRATPGAIVAARPAMVVIAGESDQRTFPLSEPWSEEYAILFDAVHQRALVGTPALLQSLYTQLMYLDGRTTRHFKKWRERIDRQDERLIVWNIDWAGAADP